jgi:hypothetical protein
MWVRPGREAGIIADHEQLAELRPVVLLHEHLLAVAEPYAGVAEHVAYKDRVERYERYLVAAAVLFI